MDAHAGGDGGPDAYGLPPGFCSRHDYKHCLHFARKLIPRKFRREIAPEDLVNQTFLIILERSKKLHFDDKDSLYAKFRVTAVFVLKNLERQHHSRTRRLEELEVQPLALLVSPAPEPEWVLLRREKIEMLGKAIEQALNREEINLLFWFFIERLPPPVIAVRLGLTTFAVYKRIERAVGKIFAPILRVPKFRRFFL